MSPLTEPLRPAEARKLLRAILASGEVVFTNHALDEMEQDGISQAEAIGVLRSGVVEPAEYERGSPVSTAGATCVSPGSRTSIRCTRNGPSPSRTPRFAAARSAATSRS